MKRIKLILLAVMGMMSVCNINAKTISDGVVTDVVAEISAANEKVDSELLQRGASQVAMLWQDSDGSAEDFAKFVKENYAPSAEARHELFGKLSKAYEVLLGTQNQVAIELSLPTILAGPEPTNIDYIMSAFNPYSHLWNDLYENKVAFITILNFPNYTLAEKNAFGGAWSRDQWAYARMGDMFTSRVPAELNKETAQANADAENYIASYNIVMGNLVDKNGDKLFPENMVLLSHWNLRDEIKSNYANLPNALDKQEMIYRVMEHIIAGTIPQEVINNAAYEWAPSTNRTWKNGVEVKLDAENTRRYERILAHFKAMKKVDSYEPQRPTGIARNFEGGMEIAPDEIEALFVNLISSPQVKKVGGLIKKQLGRDLRPYDIWYDGFKSRSTISEDDLTAQTRQKYPTPEAFERDMARMLIDLGFAQSDADFIAGKIKVEGARGSGHAWGAVGRWERSLLRTRIGNEGMDYKGYNIAVHEFGHNVEQTIDLYHIDNFTMAGVPNTGFTEALAFVFQKRDLKLLGYDQQIDDNTTLDIFWGLYEIMGVSLVDMKVWQWLYANPNATAIQLRDATIAIAKEVWNKYYQPILGEKDSPILAVYSHMVNAPMYLPNYPLGHIIEFQLEEHFAKFIGKKDFANELMRIYKLGRLTPNHWMQQAVGATISTTPILNAIDKIVK
ncbi:MAG: hypothetical protein E7080_03355 [Bacteroidales bacterium]|nr:hypothetical protein [Bacteroidales bacterium]